MKMPLRKNNNLIKMINNMLIDLPVPSNISTFWSFGSMLGLMIMLQIISGIILSMHYSCNIETAFYSMSHIMRNVNMGWGMRIIHANGASMFFILMYIHMLRGLYYKSYNLNKTWMIGVSILLLSMATAFLGYVLPWGQMSFWGATVITNLFSAIPMIGNLVVEWLWGGFSINNPTLTRFYSLHFFLPFVILFFIILHFMFLHESGSNNPLGTNSNMDKINFHPLFSSKDAIGFMMMMIGLMIVVLNYPMTLNDPENFIPANSLVTPIHIQPEWYFLFAYAILRSIPNKLGGVIALFMSILILYFLPLMNMNILSNKNYPMNKILFWMFINVLIILTWMGALPIEQPYETISMIFTMIYFLFFLMNNILMKLWNYIMKI
uniref:Cytochrome b n=1 Tax=Colossendeis megalonyx TaxID=136193 RepID=E7E077_COLMG|nr:cytochrome b [Colossendeis megalonyx]